jgi:outer membrane protein assembly factor BamB
MKEKVVVVLLLAGLACTACAADWPGWRGPNHDGVSLETGWNPEALKSGAKVLWTADVGVGYSNIAVVGGRVYAVGKNTRNLNFVVSCIDAATGKVLWMNSSVRSSGEVKATPWVDGDRLYGVGSDGLCFCLDTANGSALWQVALEKSGIASSGGQYGWASSPVVDGDYVLLNGNRAGLALDKRTGAPAWSSPMPDAGKEFYSSPVPFDMDGKRAVLLYGSVRVTAVEESTGTVLWASPPHAAAGEVMADPLVTPTGILYVERQGSVLLTADGGSVKEQWRVPVLLCNLVPPVLVGGYVFGNDYRGSQLTSEDWGAFQRQPNPLACVDPATGELVWEYNSTYSPLSAAGNELLVLELDGTLRIVDASPDGYRERGKADVLRGATGPRIFATPPVLVDGRIYVRNFPGQLICIDARY